MILLYVPGSSRPPPKHIHCPEVAAQSPASSVGASRQSCWRACRSRVSNTYPLHFRVLWLVDNITRELHSVSSKGICLLALVAVAAILQQRTQSRALAYIVPPGVDAPGLAGRVSLTSRCHICSGGSDTAIRPLAVCMSIVAFIRGCPSLRFNAQNKCCNAADNLPP
jgi:hypothetical protein